MGLFDQVDEPEADVAGVDASDNSRLFQTHQVTSGSSRRYLKVLGLVAVAVFAAGSVVWYLMRPGYGDQVLAPKGLEAAVREHFLTNVKRDATDITFFNCGSAYWARVGVEKRPDIKTNPVYLIDHYSARAVDGGGGEWSITAAPIASTEQDVPCS